MAKFVPNPDYKSTNIYKVHADRTPKDGKVNYDTIYEIVRDFLKQNPGIAALEYDTRGGSTHKLDLSVYKTDAEKINHAVLFISKANNLKTLDGKDCTLKTIPYVHIQEGWDLRMPKGSPVKQPNQATKIEVECKDPEPARPPEIVPAPQMSVPISPLCLAQP